MPQQEELNLKAVFNTFHTLTLLPGPGHVALGHMSQIATSTGIIIS